MVFMYRCVLPFCFSSPFFFCISTLSHLIATLLGFNINGRSSSKGSNNSNSLAIANRARTSKDSSLVWRSFLRCLLT